MTSARAARKELLAYALSRPAAWEDHPWGEDVVKVGKKVFVFFGVADSGPWGIGVKLGRSWAFAKTRAFVKEMGYGLGRSGWVEARFEEKAKVPVNLLREWIDESYAATAPKRVAAGAKAATANEAAAKRPARAAKRPAATGRSATRNAPRMR
jgi:predicted DNA-binding protein (MmcQ/YjbR family)